MPNLIKTNKRAGGMAQVVERLPSKDETLNSNPSMPPPQKKKEKRKADWRFQIKGD